MDIKILDSWLREHLKTNASYKDIAKYLTLCGPSIEKVDTVKNNGKLDYVYHIEVTTNRVDLMSVRGIAREASVILPEFGFKAELLGLEIDNGADFEEADAKIILKSNPTLVNRLMCVIMQVDKIDKSPDWLKMKLEATGIRSLNAVVDVTNYVMTEIGQPTHVFDYDLVAPFIGVRESKKGENITSLDNVTHKLPGGDIVFENQNGEIIDLPGIIGTKNSVVNENTKRILFFIDNNDPVKLRKTSMTLGIRTVAVTLNEKSVDPEIAETALKRGIYLYKKLIKAKQLSKIYDVYSNKYKPKNVFLTHSFLEKMLGVKIETKRVVRILKSLEIECVYRDKTFDYECRIPSFRARDILIPEDIVEEIARIYGFHNLPSILMNGTIPESNYDSPFKFETKIKNLLTSLGGSEVYTLSLISKSQSEKNSLKLKNPLGGDSEYLRTNLKNSLVFALNENKGIDTKIHLYEMSNVYISKGNGLPTEIMTTAGIFSKYDFREAKGILESFFAKLHIDTLISKADNEGFVNSKSIEFISNGTLVGKLGVLADTNYIYYEFQSEILRKLYIEFPKFKPIPKFPAQIEDITVTFPEKTTIGDVLKYLAKSHKLISRIQLNDIYNDSYRSSDRPSSAYTFRIWYQSPDKTLVNSEIEPVRDLILQTLQERFGGKIK